MRYKSFKIISYSVYYDIYSDDTPSLNDIEVHNIIVSNTPPKISNPLQIVIPETHPYFNFDIWADKVDLLDNDDHIPYNAFMFKGTHEINEIIAEYFPSIIEYYRHQI